MSRVGQFGFAVAVGAVLALGVGIGAEEIQWNADPGPGIVSSRQPIRPTLGDSQSPVPSPVVVQTTPVTPSPSPSVVERQQDTTSRICQIAAGVRADKKTVMRHLSEIDQMYQMAQDATNVYVQSAALATWYDSHIGKNYGGPDAGETAEGVDFIHRACSR